MKGYAKIRLAVFLCIMMVLPSIVSVLPMTAQEVSAAQELNIGWFYDISRHENTPIQIEKGVNSTWAIMHTFLTETFSEQPHYMQKQSTVLPKKELHP